MNGSLHDPQPIDDCECGLHYRWAGQPECLFCRMKGVLPFEVFDAAASAPLFGTVRQRLHAEEIRLRWLAWSWDSHRRLDAEPGEWAAMATRALGTLLDSSWWISAWQNHEIFLSPTSLPGVSRAMRGGGASR